MTGPSGLSPPPRRVVIAEDEALIGLDLAEMLTAFSQRGLVERAKAILQDSIGLSEPEAFRWVQETAMDPRQSMRTVAGAPAPKHGVGHNLATSGTESLTVMCA